MNINLFYTIILRYNINILKKKSDKRDNITVAVGNETLVPISTVHQPTHIHNHHVIVRWLISGGK